MLKISAIELSERIARPNPSAERVLSHARIVTPDEIVAGSVCLRDGVIVAVDHGNSRLPAAIDLEGDLLLPGLVELHTDNLEKHFLPRPGVVWPSGLAAVLAHDTQIVGSGITTVFDALAVGDYQADGLRKDIFHRSVAAIRQAAESELFRADHWLHMRCEVCDPYVVDMFEPYAADPMVGLVSVMDHTPGQRQWRDVAKFREYLDDASLSEAEIAQEVSDRIALQRDYAESHRLRILALCRDLAVPVASHDDTTEDHVAEAVAAGMTICEFPTTLEAATRARAERMHIVMGAPNVVRGGSHSGNVSALTLAEAGLLDGLSSDYAPASLMHGAFLLHHLLNLPLPKAVAAVSGKSAAMVGMTDRGEIVAGKRADLVQVHLAGDLPLVRHVWRGGRPVL